MGGSLASTGSFRHSRSDTFLLLKRSVPFPSRSGLGRELASEEKPRTMALNIPTYINLYGYGYRNVYELDELVKVADPRIEFEGSIVERASPGAAKQAAN